MAEHTQSETTVNPLTLCSQTAQVVFPSVQLYSTCVYVSRRTLTQILWRIVAPLAVFVDSVILVTARASAPVRLHRGCWWQQAHFRAGPSPPVPACLLHPHHAGRQQIVNLSTSQNIVFYKQLLNIWAKWLTQGCKSPAPHVNSIVEC